jgi:hypothetical protein
MRLAPEFLLWSKLSQPSDCLVDYFTQNSVPPLPPAGAGLARDAGTSVFLKY